MRLAVTLWLVALLWPSGMDAQGCKTNSWVEQRWWRPYAITTAIVFRQQHLTYTIEKPNVTQPETPMPVTRPLVTHHNSVTGSIKLHAIKAGPATRKPPNICIAN
jgi:hypothetical protein